MPDQLPLHPGIEVALRRFSMDETQAAKAIASGELESPLQFANSWLFALRITGTEEAYRHKLGEFVWRDPSLYLNPEFLERCRGLPVIIEHPPKQMLDAEEFADRVIGTIIHAWIREAEKEVWGIARILDDRAAKFMREHVLSTSPAVIFLDPMVNTKIEIDDKRHFLLEGKPGLIDHLAICAVGVWDKEGPPSGVEGGPSKVEGHMVSGVAADSQEEQMAEENEDKKKEEEERAAKEAADRKRYDAEAGEKLDKILTGIDSMHRRMDAHEQRMDKADARLDAFDKKRDDDKKRADDDPDEERAQAAQLEKLAEEEEREAEEAEEEEDDKRDDRRRDDRKRDDKRPAFLARHSDESAAKHSARIHAFAKRHDAKRFMKRDDESEDAHSERCDAACKRDDDKKRDDDRKRDDRKRDDDKRRDDDRRARDDRKRDDDDESEEEKKKEEEKAKADSVSKAELTEVRDRLDKLSRKVEDRSDQEMAAFADAQARADEVYAALGAQAPRPLSGETLLAYRLRLLRKLQPHSKKWKEADLPAMARADAKGFGHIEAEVFADAYGAAREPTNVPIGQLREITRRDRMTGRLMHEFVGDPLAWMSQFMLPGQCATRISRPPQN